MQTIKEMQIAELDQLGRGIARMSVCPVADYQAVQDLLKAFWEENNLLTPWQYLGSCSYGIQLVVDDIDHITQVVKLMNELDWHIMRRSDCSESISTQFVMGKDRMELREDDKFRQPKDENCPMVSISFGFGTSGKCRKVQVGVKEYPVYEIQCCDSTEPEPESV
jgi:hypothetical protein